MSIAEYYGLSNSEIITMAIVVGLLVFLAMMIKGPPEGWK